MTSRELALNILYKVEYGEGYANIEIDKEFNKSDLMENDKGLATEIVYGVLTWKMTLDEIIKRYSSVKMKKISPWILMILRIGIYQIAFLDRIPVSAAVNESVKLAKKYGHEASSKFVNAILHKIEKNEMEKLVDYLGTKNLPDNELIAIITSHPLWMVDLLLEQYDKKFVTELLNANNIKPEICIRANTLRTSREDLYKVLCMKKIDCHKGDLQDSIYIKNLIPFGKKLYIVQDEAAQLVCLKMNPKPGETILDACSAPGGKTTYLASLMKNEGRIDAWDLHPHRVKLVEELAEQLGISIIQATQHDATKFIPELKNHYDKVLLDVPCSGLGVIRKKPDIKWSRKPEDIEELMITQEEILETCSEYLKSGGTLVYSTCTVLQQENEEQIKRFLSKHLDFSLKETIHLFPHMDGMDGFYIAVLKKV